VSRPVEPVALHPPRWAWFTLFPAPWPPDKRRVYPSTIEPDITAGSISRNQAPPMPSLVDGRDAIRGQSMGDSSQTAEALAGRRGRSDATGVIFLMALCQFVLTADFAIVGVALPSIGRSLGAAPGLLAWVVSTSGLTLSGFLLLGGRLTDSLGQRRCLQWSLTLFGACSLISALAPNIQVLIAARGLQGMAAAVLMPSSFSLINTLIEPGPARHRALGVFGMMQGASVITALTVGGFLATTFGWRSVFLLNLPFLLLACVLVFRKVPAREGPRKPVKDVPGAIMICLATALLLWSLSTLGRTHFTSTGGAMGLVVAVLAYGGFFAWERRVSTPLVPRGIIDRNLIGGGLGGMGLLAAWGGVFLLANLYMQTRLGFSAARSGLSMIPYALAVVVAGRVTSIAMGRRPSRQIALAGIVLAVAGMLLLAFMAPLERYDQAVLLGILIVPFGGMMSHMGVLGQATAPVSPEHQGTASSLLFTCHQIGVALGGMVSLTAVSAGVVASQAMTATNFRNGYLACALLALLGGLAMWAGLGAAAKPRPDRRAPSAPRA
jgi:DHA2 family methylenomycin A resistance protein-like MFS transporter